MKPIAFFSGSCLFLAFTLQSYGQVCNVSITDSTMVNCFGACNGAATAVGTGVTPFTFSWSPGGQAISNPSNLCAGTHTVTFIDANSCSKQATVAITQPDLLVLDGDSVRPTCNGDSNGTATVTPAGGTTPYTYIWNDPYSQATTTADSLKAGTYTCTVTDNKGCSDSIAVVVTEPAILLANASKTDISCFGQTDGQATANPTGGTSPYSYSWSTGSTTQSIGVLSAGSYSVTVTDSKGCQGSGSVTIVEPPLLTTSISSSTNISCNGGNNGSATVGASGGTGAYTYLWNPSSQTTATASNLTAGSYTAMVTDARGCTTTASVTLSEPTALTTSVTKTDVSCNGGSDGTASVTAGGGTSPYAYLWSNSATTSSIGGLTAGTYSVTVTDNKGCTKSDNAVVGEPAALTTSIAKTDVSCNGGSDGTASVTASGGTSPYAYLWNNSVTTSSISGLTANTYSVTVTDSKGCTKSDSAVVSEPLALTTSIAKIDVSCNGGSDGSASVTASGGTSSYTFFWSNSATTSSIGGLTAGTYKVTVTDGKGCTKADSSVVGEPVALTTTVTKTDVTSNGGSDGTAAVAVAGGSVPYAYLWSNSATTSSIGGLTAGTYKVTVTDNKGCTKVDSAVVAEPSGVASSMKNSEKIRISPNPARDMVTVNFPGNGKQKKIVIHGFDGRVFKEYHLGNGMQVIRIPINIFPAGIYTMIFEEDGIIKGTPHKLSILRSETH